MALVSELTVVSLESSLGNTLPHEKHKHRVTDAVSDHPSISDIESGDMCCCIRLCVQGMLDISPSCKHRTQDHETERGERHARDLVSEDEFFTICDEDDGQVLGNGVDGDC